METDKCFVDVTSVKLLAPELYLQEKKKTSKQEFIFLESNRGQGGSIKDFPD